MFAKINYLKTNILECYCSILQGLSESGGKQAFLTREYLASVVDFLSRVALDHLADSQMIKQAIALTSDLCREFPDPALPILFHGAASALGPLPVADCPSGPA